MVLCRICCEDVVNIVEHMGSKHPDYSKTIVERKVAAAEHRSNRRSEKAIAAFVKNIGYSMCFLSKTQNEILALVKDIHAILVQDRDEKFKELENKYQELLKSKENQ